MAPEFHEGDHLSWQSHGGTAEGTVRREIADDTEAAGRTVRASSDDPQYEVQSGRSGGTGHEPNALQKD